MRATLEFDLPQDQVELELAQKAGDLSAALSDFSNRLRVWYKYENRKSIPIEELRECFNEILREHDINL